MADNTKILLDYKRIRELIKKVLEDEFNKQEQIQQK